MFEKTKEFCDSLLELGLPGFDLAVFKGGECILRYMNGYSDLENKIAMNGKERYNIYSCSKVITCTAAMQLWEKGLFSLEDKLSDYMPEFEKMMVRCDGGVKKAEKPILIKHLFEMTAGFSYNTKSENILKCKDETNGECATREAMKYLAKDPLLFEPGTRWEYSLCHDVLAALVEVVSGEKFEVYVKKNIFDVLSMKDSTFLLPQDEIDTITERYVYRDGKPVNSGKNIGAYKFGSSYASGGAGCISTVDDYIKFLEGLRTNKLIKSETLELMITNRLSEEQRRSYLVYPEHGYGLGVRCPKENGKYSDFGWGGAACAYLAVDKENELSLYFSAHTLSSPAQGLRSMVYRFIRAELFDSDDFENISHELKSLHNYNFTY